MYFVRMENEDPELCEPIMAGSPQQAVEFYHADLLENGTISNDTVEFLVSTEDSPGEQKWVSQVEYQPVFYVNKVIEEQ